MKKKLTILVGIMIFGLAIVGANVALQSRKLVHVIGVDSQVSRALYAEVNFLVISTKEIESHLAKIYLAKFPDDIETHKTAILGSHEKIKERLKLLLSPQFASVHDSKFSNTDSKDGSQALTVKEYITKLDQELEALKSDIQSNVELRISYLEENKNLEKKRVNLSKVYRSSMNLMDYDEEIFGQISRATLTVLSSLSTRDLNFAGRGIFEENLAKFEQLKLRKADREKWESLKTEFVSTLELALKVSSYSNDYELLSQKMEETVARLEEISKFSADSFSTFQEHALTTASNTNLLTIGSILIVAILCSVLAVIISKQLIKSLASIVNNMKSSGMKVLQTSDHLKDTSGSLSKGASQSAAFLEETLASLTEISSMVRLNSESAGQCAKLIAESSKSAVDGQKQVEKLSLSMSKISESSKKIEESISLIDDIAFQTNLLALNAAVEAARAGEQGKGFAVVADAVRALAQKSALAAQEINQLIVTSREATQEGVEAAESSTQVLGSIVSSIEKVESIAKDIANASQEQNTGLSQVNKALSELDNVSQLNAQSAQNTASSSDGLTEEANELNKLVFDLEQLIGQQQTTESSAA